MDEHRVVQVTAPDVVVEFVTDESEAWMRERKLPVYRRAGVGVVWFLNISRSVFSILVADGEGWMLKTEQSDGAVTLYPFVTELPLGRDYWESWRDESRRKREKVAELEALMEEVAREGMSEHDQVSMLLARLSVWPSIDDWSEGVGSWMLRSPSVVVRARMLMVCNVSMTRALEIAREEIEAERVVDSIGLEAAEKLCLRYCELHALHGPAHPEVRALAARAHAFAREELQQFWWRRGDDGTPPDANASELLAEYRRSGHGEARVLELLRSEQGPWQRDHDDWEHALRAFIASLPTHIALRLSSCARCSVTSRHGPNPSQKSPTSRLQSPTSRTSTSKASPSP